MKKKAVSKRLPKRKIIKIPDTRKPKSKFMKKARTYTNERLEIIDRIINSIAKIIYAILITVIIETILTRILTF